LFVAFAVFVALAAWPIASWLGVKSGDFLAGLFPTIVGVVVGIPIAWWGIRVAEGVGAERAADDARRRRADVLRLIGGELDRNLAEMRGGRAAQPRDVTVPLLAVETWRAMSDGGELRTIDDPQLIGHIANAYHRIDATSLLERLLLNWKMTPSSYTIEWHGKSPAEDVRAALVDQDPHTISAIDVALEAIRAALSE
jgi:hypothetical protein